MTQNNWNAFESAFDSDYIVVIPSLNKRGDHYVMQTHF